MGFFAFLLVLTAAAAVLALWVLARFPDAAPERLWRAVAHFALSLGFVWTVPSLVEPAATAALLPALTGLFLLVLPVLVYACLAGAWVLRLVHEAITQ